MSTKKTPRKSPKIPADLVAKIETVGDVDVASFYVDTERRETRTRETATTSGIEYVRVTTDGAPKRPCLDCGARTRRRDNGGAPRCASCQLMLAPLPGRPSR